MTDTIETMKQRTLTAWQTMRRLYVGKVGPSQSLTYWPEHVLDYPASRMFRRIPSAGEIADADDVQDMANKRLTETERKDLWLWCRLKDKAEKDTSIQRHCDKFGLKEHKYRRHIEKIFQKLAGIEKNIPIARFSTGVDGSRKTGKLGTQSDVICKDGITAWRPADAKPVRDPNIREIALRATKRQKVGP